MAYTSDGVDHRSVDDPLVTLATRQHGVVACWQGRSLGLSADAVRSRVLGRHWEPVTDHVLRRTGSHRGRAQRAMAIVLDSGPGALLAHTSAAAWWRAPGPQLEPLHSVRDTRSHRLSALGRVHTVRELPSHWTTELDGIPIGRPELVALQLFASQPYERAERWVERLWSMRLLDGRSLVRFLCEQGRRGRNGSAGIRRYLMPRGSTYVPAASNLETRTQQILASSGIAVERQVDVGDDVHWTGRVDFRVVGTNVLIEVQSEFHHSALVDEKSDLVRIRRLRDAGFIVVEITDVEAFHRPRDAVDRVRRALIGTTLVTRP